MCAHHGQLGVALTLGAAVPPHSAVQRWFGEPVRAIVVPTSIFQNNKRGFPALSKAHQAVLLSFFPLNVQVGVNCSAGRTVLHASQERCPAAVALHWAAALQRPAATKTRPVCTLCVACMF